VRELSGGVGQAAGQTHVSNERDACVGLVISEREDLESQRANVARAISKGRMRGEAVSRTMLRGFSTAVRDVLAARGAQVGDLGQKRKLSRTVVAR
jgi:hypothetical protein